MAATASDEPQPQDSGHHGFDREEERQLKELDYYHGFIPREDLLAVMKADGDFLLRVSETDNNLVPANERDKIKREIVLSICVEHDDGGVTSPITETTEGQKKKMNSRNVIIRRVPKNRYFVEMDKVFDTFRELISYYQINHATVNKSQFILKNPVKLQKWELLHSAISLGRQLGEGAFGEVRQAVWTRKKKTTDVAVKLTKGTSDLCKAKIKEMMREARLQRNLRHKNVVRLHGVAVDEQPLYIVLELVRGGSLNSYLVNNKCSLDEKLQMCFGAARGIEHLHKAGIIHRDLAARNCLYDQTEKLVKISDFGLSRQTKEYQIKTAVKLPIKWLAPETITTFVFTAKSDVYSYGVMIHEIFGNGAEPWVGFTNTEVKKAVIEGRTLPMTEAPEQIRDFVREKVFSRLPADRLSMTEIVRFLTEHLDPPNGMDTDLPGDLKKKKGTEETDKSAFARLSRTTSASSSISTASSDVQAREKLKKGYK